MIPPWLGTAAERLAQALEAQRLGHAPLLHGPAGIGKRALARWLVARILCADTSGQAPCGTCRSCLLLEAGTHPDLFIARVPDDKTQIPVDTIRELCGGLQLTPSLGRHRVGLIEPAERMNRNAANALLKTLEEPSPGTWLILVSDRPDDLPATVRSRCQQLALRPPTRAEALYWMQENSPQRDDQQLALALDFCGEAPLKAQALLCGDGIAFGSAIREALLTLASGRPIPAETAENWSSRADESWAWLAYWVRSWLGPRLGLSAAQGQALPARCDPARLAQAWQRALEGRSLAESSIRADLLLDKWLLEWQSIFAVGT